MVGLAAVLAFATPGVASAYVYWGNFTTGAIGRANLDGSTPNLSFVPGVSTAFGAAVDGSHVYWTSGTTGQIGRANLDGSAPKLDFITGANFPTGVAVDGSHVYWTNVGGTTIGRANLDGTSPVQSFITMASSPGAVAVDGTHIYWGNSGGATTIGRANLDASGVPNQSFITGTHNPLGLAVDGTHIYWTNNSTGTIGRANLDGTSPNQTFIPAPAGPRGIAVDGAHIYWSNDASGTIGRANLDGTDINQGFIATGNTSAQIALDPFPVATSTALACAPTSVLLSASAICTATVAASATSVAGDSVAFSSGGGGLFAPPSSCLLSATGPTSGSCQLGYTPSEAGTQTLSASYAGGLKNAASTGNAAVDAVGPPSNLFTLAKPELNKKKGTATIVATVPGAGALTDSGTGLKEHSATASAAGAVTLKISGARKTVKKLKHKGKARVTASVTFSPAGGDPSTQSYPLKLRRK
jgi:virginiamycin B lyase